MQGKVRMTELVDRQGQQDDRNADQQINNVIIVKQLFYL